MHTKLRSLLERVEREKQNPELEFELRFGTYQQQRFLPDLTLDKFQSLQLLFSDFTTYSLNELPEETVTLFPNNIRRFQDGSYQKKEKLESVDQPFAGDMTLRFSFAKEYEVKESKEKSIATRTRKRWVYWPSIYSYENTPYEYNLTRVNGTIHELEIEYHLQNVLDIKAAVEESVIPVKAVFKVSRVQQSVSTLKPSISSSELFNRMQLRPRHPVNFPNPVLTACKPPYWSSFTITNKLNGEYVLLIGEYKQDTLVNLFATTDQSTVLIYSAQTSSTTTYSYSLWEAERFRNIYHVFDMFLDHDTDISHQPHSTRVLAAHEALRQVTNVRVKTFYPVSQIADRLKEWGNGDNDGIIFTPAGSARCVWPPIYKWKFYEELTIDMCMVEGKPGNFHLKVWTTAQAMVEWKGTHRFPLHYPMTYREHTGKVKNGEIWEVRYDFRTQRVHLGKPRPDKKRPNIKYVAENVWNDMAVPITEEILIEWVTTSTTTNSEPNVFFDKFVTNWLTQVSHPFEVHVLPLHSTSSTFLYHQQFPTFEVLFTECNERIDKSQHKLCVAEIRNRLSLRRDIQRWIASKIKIDSNIVALSELRHTKHVLSTLDIPKLVGLQTQVSDLSKLDWSHAEVFPFMGEIQVLVNTDCGLWMYHLNSDVPRKLDETPSSQITVALVQEFDQNLYSVLYGVVVYSGGSGELSAEHLQRFIDNHTCLTHTPPPTQERLSDLLKSVRDNNSHTSVMVKTPSYNSSCRHHIHIFPASEADHMLKQVETRLSSAYLRHHNSRKRELIERYCRHATVIDVGIGEGGDLGKYRDAQTSTILGIEPNVQNHLGLMSRLVQSYANMMGRVFVNTDRAQVVDFRKWLQTHPMYRYAMATNVANASGFPSGAHHEDRLKTNAVGEYSMTRRGDADAMCDEVLPLLGESVSGWVVMDGTANMGGDTLQFSKYFAHVHAVEIDTRNAQVLKGNVDAFGCKNVTLHEGDFLQVWPRHKHQVDVVYLDPPWGGPQYKEKASLTLFLSQTKPLGEVIHEVMGDTHAPKFLILKLPNNCDMLITEEGKTWLKPYDYNVVSIRGAFTVVAIRNRQLVEPRFKAVDAVTSFFSLSFFFIQTHEDTYPDMDALLRSIQSNLRPGGHFVVTTVDGDRLLTRLDDHDGAYRFKKSGFYRYHGLDVEVALPGTIVGDHQVESLVDVGYISKWLTKHNFEVVEDSYFDSHSPDMFRCFEDDEIELNQLYRTVVYRSPFEFCVYLSRESKESQESVSIMVKDTVNVTMFQTWKGTVEHPLDNLNIPSQEGLVRLHYNRAWKQFVVVECLTDDNQVFSLEQMNRTWNKMYK